jgi:hypothetical protein
MTIPHSEKDGLLREWQRQVADAVNGKLDLTDIAAGADVPLSGVHANVPGMTVRLLRLGALHLYYLSIGTNSGTLAAATTLATVTNAGDRPSTNLRCFLATNGNAAVEPGLILAAGTISVPHGLPAGSWVGQGWEISP